MKAIEVPKKRGEKVKPDPLKRKEDFTKWCIEWNVGGGDAGLRERPGELAVQRGRLADEINAGALWKDKSKYHFE